MIAIFFGLIGITGTIYFYCKRKSKWLQACSYILFLIGLFALLPFYLLPASFVSPTQIIYRFDENRYIQLIGSRCQGMTYFIDEKEHVYTQLAPHSMRLFVPQFYYHPSKNYIAIPYSDLSGIKISNDGGRTFFVGGFPKIEKPQVEDIASFTVVNDQGFFLTNSGEIYMGHKPFGSVAGYFVSKTDLSNDYLHGYTRSLFFQDFPETVPAVPDDYTGWNKMKCNYSQPPPEVATARTKLMAFQQVVRQSLGMESDNDKK